MHKTKLLIVESHEGLRAGLLSVLSQEGYEVLAAQSGQEGLAILSQERPSLAIIDMELPDIQGIEIFRRFKETLPETEVIMIASHGTIQAEARSIKTGGFDVLEKPLNLERLMTAIQKALKGRSS